MLNFFQGICQDTNKKNQQILNDSLKTRNEKNTTSQIDKDSIEVLDNSVLCLNYEGGEDAMIEYVQKGFMLTKGDNANYGKVEVNITVNEKGKIDNIKILKGVSVRVDREVIRIILGMPSWKWTCKDKPKGHFQITKYLTIPINSKTYRK
ncbi:MAG: energy transducer TonB [Bacteroidales bacterium]|nr:energy transducer TonB [Bacteroidales bacterium]